MYLCVCLTVTVSIITGLSITGLSVSGPFLVQVCVSKRTSTQKISLVSISCNGTKIRLPSEQYGTNKYWLKFYPT